MNKLSQPALNAELSQTAVDGFDTTSLLNLTRTVIMLSIGAGRQCMSLVVDMEPDNPE